jgi:hypothetical protein
MTPEVWIAETLARPPLNPPEDPGEGWTRVGEVDTFRENDLQKQIQIALGSRSSGLRRSVNAYLDCSPDSRWAAAALNDTGRRFWLALDFRRYHRRFLVTSARAEVRPIARRKPEAHPGLLREPVFISVFLAAARGHALFDQVSES